MSVVTNPDILALGLVGKVGKPLGYGDQEYGNFEYGEEEDIYGIYRRRPTEKGITLVKCQFYEPTNPKTEAQMSWRGIFSDGVLAWQNLSESAKNVYREKVKILDLSGFNLFMREYLLAH